MPANGGYGRDTLELNEDVLLPVIKQLGTRVGVEVLEVHLLALYKLMKLPLGSFGLSIATAGCAGQSVLCDSDSF